MKRVLFLYFILTLSSYSAQKGFPILYIVFERNFKNDVELVQAFDSLQIKNSTIKKYNINFYYGGSRLLKPTSLVEKSVNFYLLKNFCKVCDSLNSWNITDENSFQIEEALNPCKTFNGISKNDINTVLKANIKKHFNSNCLIYIPTDRSSISFKNIPKSVEKSSEVNFDIKLDAGIDFTAKIGMEVLYDTEWEILEQKTIELKTSSQNNFSFDLESDTRFCIEYEEISGCTVEKCSDIIEYKYKNKIQPLILILDEYFEGIPTNISENDPDPNFNCGAEFEIMPESDDWYYFIFKKQKGIKSISLKLADLCSNDVLKNCPNVYLNLIEDVDFEVSHPGYTRYKVHKDEFDPGVANQLTCSDLWNYKIDVNSQPLREWDITFTPQIDENSQFISNQNTQIKLIFKTCGGH